MARYCIKYGILKHHFCRLADIPLSKCWSGDGYVTSGGTLGDLGPADEIFLFSNKRALTFRRANLSAKVSLMMAEPQVVQRQFYGLIPWAHRRFHRIATHSDPIIATCPNAEKWIHGGRWVDVHTSQIPNKTAMTSIIASKQKSSGGHKLRHELIEWAQSTRADLRVLGKGYQWLEDKSDGHIPFRFSVVIENSQSAGYFTEKLIDAILCDSIPIYWGDPEISAYFDTSGFIQCDTMMDIQSAITKASAKQFEKLAPIVAQNKARAMALFDTPNAMTSLAGPKIFDFD